MGRGRPKGSVSKKNAVTRSLTPEEQMFANVYVGTGNGPAALRESGINVPKRYIGNEGQYAYQLRQRLHMRNAIADLREQIAFRNAITPDWVLGEHVELYHEAREKGDLRFALNALTKIGEVCGAYEQKLSIHATFENLSEDQLDAAIEGIYEEIKHLEAPTREETAPGDEQDSSLQSIPEAEELPFGDSERATPDGGEPAG